MTVDDIIRDEILLYDIKIEAAKISVLSSVKIDKYCYLTGEDILPSDQISEIEQAKLTCSPLIKTWKNKPNQLNSMEKKCLSLMRWLKKFREWRKLWNTSWTKRIF